MLHRDSCVGFDGAIRSPLATIYYAAGRVYASNGTVLDVTSVPHQIGILPRGFVVVDEPSGYGFVLAPLPCRLSRFAIATMTIDREVSCGGFLHMTIGDLTRIAPGRFIAIGMPDRYGNPSALYTLEAPF